MLVADFTFIDFFWSVFLLSLWVMWLWLLFTIWNDIFRRRDISGLTKTLWIVFTIVAPFVGVLVYMIAQGTGMAERGIGRARRQREEYAEYVRETADSGGAAAEIERGQQLLERGVITQAEFDVLKTNALV
jgi:hypothetical protein